VQHSPKRPRDGLITKGRMHHRMRFRVRTGDSLKNLLELKNLAILDAANFQSPLIGRSGGFVLPVRITTEKTDVPAPIIKWPTYFVK